MRSDETRRARVWGLILRVTPYLRGQNPLWHLAFSYWDDATECGCVAGVGSPPLAQGGASGRLMVVRPVSHARLRDVVARWRRLEARATLGGESRVAEVYRQCANDVDLIIRDDETIQPRERPTGQEDS